MTYGTWGSWGLSQSVIDNCWVEDKPPLQAEVGRDYGIWYSSGRKAPTPITNLDVDSSASIAAFQYCIIFSLYIYIFFFFHILSYTQRKPLILMKQKVYSENITTYMIRMDRTDSATD